MLVSSPDITTFDYEALLDASTQAPSLTLTNTSTVVNAANLQWVFEIYSPSGTAIYRGDFAAPDRVLWSTPFIQTSGFPRPYNQIEWSGKPYEVIVSVKDSLGNVFVLPKSIRVCRPIGNKQNDKNTYGTAQVKITTRCRDAKLLVEDNTQYQYQGVVGVSVQSTFELRYPPDGTGVSQPSFIARSFSSALIPITQSGSGYLYYFTSVVDYTLGDGVTVRLKHIATQTFSVYCNLDFSPVFTSLLRLISDAENGRCEDREDAQRTISIVTSKLLLATTAVLWPQNEAIEPYKLIDEINELAGWSCDCNTSSVTPLSSIGMDGSGQTYEVVSDGGDVTGSIEEITGGIRIHVQDVSYRFVLCDTIPSAAFSITPSVNGQTKTFCLNVDEAVLSDEILQQFEGNTTFKNRLNQLIVSNLSSATVSVNTRCVLPQSRTYSYSFVTPQIAVGQTYIVTQLVADGVTKPINFLFDRTNPNALTAALNNTNVGQFSVLFVAGILTISVSGIGADISSFTGELSGTTTPQEMAMTRTVSDNSSSNIGTVLQALIDFVCSFTLSKIKAGQGFTIKDINLLTGAVVSRPIQNSDDLSTLLQTLVTANNNIADYLNKVKPIDCGVLQALFPTTATALTDTAMLYATDAGGCVSINAKGLATKVLQLAASDPDVKNNFCAAQTACGAAVCAPVANAAAVYDPTGQNITITITNTAALRYRVAYRAKGSTGAWLQTTEVAAASGISTTQVFGGIAPGVYEVQVTAICGSGEATPYLTSTQACGAPTALFVSQSGGNFVMNVSGLPTNAAGFRIEILQPDGGKQAKNFDLSLFSVTMPIPSGVFGDFTIVGRTICDVNNAWYSDPTGAVTSTVAAPATCPAPTAILTTDVTATTATVIVTKPVVGNVPQYYTLTYNPAGGGTQSLTASSGGSTVSFALTGLVPNTIYFVSAQSSCGTGTSDVFNGDRFATSAASGANSSLNNSGATVPTSVTLQINGAVVAGTTNMAASSGINFVIPNYTYANVVLTVCGGGAIDAQVVSGGATHNPSSAGNGVFAFNGLALTSPISVSFSNTDIP